LNLAVFAKMPRSKQTKTPDLPTSDDVQASVADVDESTQAPGGGDFAVGVAEVEPAVEVKPKAKKGLRKPKPCVRCDERRKREREYARASRVRAKLTKTPATTPVETNGAEEALDVDRKSSSDATDAPRMVDA
jgi:hypothetical protein